MTLRSELGRNPGDMGKPGIVPGSTNPTIATESEVIERVREVCTKALKVKVAGSSEGDAAMAAMASVILRILDGVEPSREEPTRG